MNVTALVPSPPGYPHQLLVSWTTLDDVIGYTLQCSAVGSSPLVYNTLGASPQGGSPTASVLLPVIPNTLYNCSVSATCGSGDCSLKTNVLVRTPEMGKSLYGMLMSFYGMLMSLYGMLMSLDNMLMSLIWHANVLIWHANVLIWHANVLIAC